MKQKKCTVEIPLLTCWAAGEPLFCRVGSAAMRVWASGHPTHRVVTSDRSAHTTRDCEGDSGVVTIVW